MANVKVEVDAGDVRFYWTDDEPGEAGEQMVCSTLGEAKAWALAQALPERDSWVQCVNNIRSATRRDVLP